MENHTFLTILSINFILIFMGINYVQGQQSNLGTINDTTKVSEVLTPDSMNETRFNSNESNNSFNDTTKVSEVLTPDSMNETRFSD